MTIRYYDMLIVSDDIAERYADCIDSLTHLDTRSARLHELKGWSLNGNPVFAAAKGVDDGRDRGKGRLLFTYVSVNGQVGLCCYRELPDHKYDLARKTHKSSVKTMESLLTGKKIIPVKDSSAEHTAQISTESPLERSSEPENQLNHIIYYRDRFICLDDAQQQVFFVKKWPLIMSGPPGSGKSCDALALLNSWVRQAQNDGLFMPVEAVAQSSNAPAMDTAPRFAYVSESPELRRRMQEIRRSQPGYGLLPSDPVHFTNYRDILLAADPGGTHGKRFLSREESRSFFLKNFNRFKKCLPTPSKGKRKPTAAPKGEEDALQESFYQEGLVVAGCSSLQDYLAIGTRTSQLNFDDPLIQKSVRTKFYQSVKRHQDALAADRCLDPLLYQPSGSLPVLFSGITVDEAQDYSPAQARLLNRLSGRVAFGIDTHQNIGAGAYYSLRAWLEHALQAETITLNYPYRCPNHVIDAANLALSLKLDIAGGLADKHDYPLIVRSDAAREGCRSGQVSFKSGLPVGDELETLRQEIAHKASVAIVTRPALAPELRQKLNHPLVFSPTEIKGLEYEDIIVWDIFSDNRFYAANKHLAASSQTASTSKKPVQHRAKEKTVNLALKNSITAMNELYTTLTRSTQRLRIYQIENPHQLGYLVRAFQELVQHLNQEAVDPVQETRPSTDADWMNQMKTLILHDRPELTQLAQNIWVDTLKQPLTAFESHRRSLLGLPPVAEPVRPAASTRVARPVAVSSSSRMVPPKPRQPVLKPAPVKTVSVARKAIPVASSTAKKEDYAPAALVKAITDGNFPKTRKLLAKPGNHANMLVEDTKDCLLIHACKVFKADNKIIQLLLEKGASANSVKYRRSSALVFAAIYGNTKTLELFRQHKADFNLSTNSMSSQLSMLFAASTITRQRLDNAKFMIDNGADVNKAIEVLSAVIPYAAEFLSDFLATGIWNPDSFDSTRQNHVLSYIIEGNIPALARFIAENGPDLYVGNGCPALVFTASAGTPEMLEFFLTRPGMDVNVRDNVGNTALMVACGAELRVPIDKEGETRYLPIVKLLLAYDADINLVNDEGKTALMLAEAAGMPRVAALIRAQAQFNSLGSSIGSVPRRAGAPMQRPVSLVPATGGSTDGILSSLMQAARSNQDGVISALESLAPGASSVVSPEDVSRLFGVDTRGLSLRLTDCGSFFKPTGLPAIAPPCPQPASSSQVDDVSSDSEDEKPAFR